MGQDGLVREQVALRVLHADGGVHRLGQREARHVADVEPDVEALLGRALAQEGDVLRREIEAGHAVASAPETDQVGPGAAGDVEHGLDRAPGEAAEAVGEEVHLLLPVHVESDLVVARRRVVALFFHFPHQVRMASRRIQEAVMPVRPEGSKAWATSMRSVPTIRQGSSSLTISTSSEAVMPQGSGAPVPGRLRRIEDVDVDRHVERMPGELRHEAPDGLDGADGVRGKDVRRLPPVLFAGARAHARPGRRAPAPPRP